MLFLLVLAFLTIVHFVCLLISFYKKRFALFLLHDTAVILQVVSFYFGMKTSGSPAEPNYSVYLLLGFSLLTIGIFFYGIRKATRDTSKLFSWRNGDRLLFIILSFYIVFTIWDHIWFYAQNPEESGTANFNAIKAEGVDCDTFGIIRVDGDEIVYRCPHGLMYGVFTNNPFVPWPAYFEGRSKDLKRVYDDILAEGKATREELEADKERTE